MYETVREKENTRESLWYSHWTAKDHVTTRLFHFKKKRSLTSILHNRNISHTEKQLSLNILLKFFTENQSSLFLECGAGRAFQFGRPVLFI